jgi:hypothetical protein
VPPIFYVCCGQSPPSVEDHQRQLECDRHEARCLLRDQGRAITERRPLVGFAGDRGTRALGWLRIQAEKAKDPRYPSEGPLRARSVCSALTK